MHQIKKKYFKEYLNQQLFLKNYFFIFYNENYALLN